jgi:uncharacterized membrane protein
MPGAVAPCAPASDLAAPLDIVLYPARSLPAAGFYALMAAIVALSIAIGVGFVLAGAWPVSGFLGLDVLLVYLAFRWNYREGRRAELIRLDREGLCVRQIGPDGRARDWRFEPYWVRVTVDEGHDRRLLVGSRGRALAIGTFLTAEERVELARALRAALATHRRVTLCAPAPPSATTP